MKRLLLIAWMLVTVVLAGGLHGYYKHQESDERLSFKEAYMVQYPVTIPMVEPIVTRTVPF